MNYEFYGQVIPITPAKNSDGDPFYFMKTDPYPYLLRTNSTLFFTKHVLSL